MDEKTEAKIRKKTKSLIALTLDETCELNDTYPIECLEKGGIYLVIGEVAETQHYILYEHWSPTKKTMQGRILPGMFELYRFRKATENEF